MGQSSFADPKLEDMVNRHHEEVKEEKAPVHAGFLSVADAIDAKIRLVLGLVLLPGVSCGRHAGRSGGCAGEEASYFAAKGPYGALG